MGFVARSCLSGDINGVQVPIHLDTMSMSTVMSAEAWRKICSSDSTHSLLNKASKNLHSVLGGQSHILGNASVKFKLGLSEFVHPVTVIEQLQQSCILGCDFLERYGCIIRYDKKCLKIGDESILFQEEDVIVRSEADKKRRPKLRKKNSSRSTTETEELHHRTSALSPIVVEMVRKAQAEDPDIGPVLQQVKLGVAGGKSLSDGYSPTTKTLLDNWSSLEVKENCLYLKSTKAKYKAKPRIILPVVMVPYVCQEFHVDKATRKHQDRFRTELRIRKDFWRPGLKGMVSNFVNFVCKQCKLSKKENTVREEEEVLEEVVSSSGEFSEGEGEDMISMDTAKESDVGQKVHLPECAGQLNLKALKEKFLKRGRRIRERAQRAGSA